jgi:hypothetical protein
MPLIIIILIISIIILGKGFFKMDKNKTGIKQSSGRSFHMDTSVEDFGKGDLKGVRVSSHEDGALELEKQNGSYLKEGTYTSQTFDAAPFKYAVVSWNADTPGKTYIKIQAQVRSGDKWSSWFTIANWGTGIKSESEKKQEDDISRVMIDTIALNGEASGNGIRYRVALLGDGAVSPVVRMVSFVAYNNTDRIPGETHLEKDLDVPMISQMQQNPKIANVICSPTSVSMVMQYYSLDISAEKAAEGVFDNGAKIYGNWPFNTAFAASRGFTAYVDRFESLDDIRKEIFEGRPVIASISFDKGELDNAPIEDTDGHLIVVRGFTTKNGADHVIVNDPAAPTHETVKREYRVDQFLKAWKGIVYIIRKQ